MAKKSGPKPGAKVKQLTDREKFVAQQKSKALTGGHWAVVRGKRIWVKD